MEHLYVCLFSNGHIKVGRSIDPEARIASHASRVACMGVDLVEFKTFPVLDEVAAREAMLIARCTEHANKKHQNEWFAGGITFAMACMWGAQAANEQLSSEDTASALDSIWVQCITKLQANGLNQSQIALLCGCGQATVSDLLRGGSREPRYSLGVKLLALLEHAKV